MCVKKLEVVSRFVVLNTMIIFGTNECVIIVERESNACQCRIQKQIFHHNMSCTLIVIILVQKCNCQSYMKGFDNEFQNVLLLTATLKTIIITYYH